jgi:hypothetical protein
LAKCPTCNQLLTVGYEEDSIHAICPKCLAVYIDQIECECGDTIKFIDLATLIRIIPEDACNKSIQKAADKFNKQYRGTWCIQGLSLKYFESRQTIKYPRLSLSDFQLWRTQGRLDYPIRCLKTNDIQNILNKTKEKCWRDGTPPSEVKCMECKTNLIHPKWIKSGNTCLLRLFGIPIGKKFDGVHHGHEKADIRYEDVLFDDQQLVNVWIHVKSRSQHCPPQGMGRTTLPIQGLYKQVIFSAFEAATKGNKVQVIGIAIPNPIKTDVINSMAYAINILGFSFLVVDDNEWQKIICSAYEQSEFENIPS